MLELDRDVVDLTLMAQPSMSAGAYDDPRSSLVIGDALEWFKKFSSENGPCVEVSSKRAKIKYTVLQLILIVFAVQMKEDSISDDARACLDIVVVDLLDPEDPPKIVADLFGEEFIQNIKR